MRKKEQEIIWALFTSVVVGGGKGGDGLAGRGRGGATGAEGGAAGRGLSGVGAEPDKRKINKDKFQVLI